MDRADGQPTVAVVLAAGGASRFAGAVHKLDAVLDASGGDTVASRSIGVAIDAGIGDVVVVTGALGLTDRLAALRDRAQRAGVELVTVHNPDWAEGQAGSLQRAVAAAEDRNAEAIVVGLADQPFVTAEAWRRVAASDAPIAVATYDDASRNPVRLHASVWPDLPRSGDEGARSLIRLRADQVQRIPCPGSGADIDTVEDLRSWQKRSSTNSP